MSLITPDPTKDYSSETPPDDFMPHLVPGAAAPGTGSVIDAAASFTSASIGKPPVIELPQDGAITLDRGIFYEGEYHTDAHAREVTGEDEEFLAKFDIAKPGGAFLYFDSLLVRTIEQIGTVRLADMKQSERQTLLRGLLLGDRDSLLLAIVRATYGKERVFEGVTCPFCTKLNDIHVDLVGDFPLQHLDDPQQLNYHVELSRGRHVDVRLPVGGDILAISSSKEEQTAQERNTLMIQRILVNVNGEPVGDAGITAKKMNIADRRKILNMVIDLQPGPRVEEVKSPCFYCEEEFPLQLNMASLLQI
jgi:hypothetical protein